MKTRNVRRSWTVNTQYKKYWWLSPTNQGNSNMKHAHQNRRIKDFPQVRPQPQRETPTYYVGKISWKLYENVENWTWEGHAFNSLLCGSALTKVPYCPCVCHLLLFLRRQNCTIFLGLDFFCNLEQGIACTYSSRKTIWDRIQRSCHRTLHRTQSP